MKNDSSYSNIKSCIRDIPDFPKPGIVFKDITPLLANGDAFRDCIVALAEQLPAETDFLVGMESRGFLFGAALAVHTGIGFIPVRKAGKLPHTVHRVEYDLEYGTDQLEIHQDALSQGDKVVIVDDLLATGGTASATATLIRELGATPIAALFVIELDFLKGRTRLTDVPVSSLLHY